MSVQGYVVAEFEVNPELITFTRDKAAEAIVRFSCKPSSEIDFGAITASHPSISAEWDSSVDANLRCMTVCFDQEQSADVKWQVLEIRVATTSRAEPLYTVRVQLLNPAKKQFPSPEIQSDETPVE